ncbi:transcriptional regulator, TraR/DksA family [Ruegeria halocynthiae]|uniref:Transcriptional regulator, TraR/DksA family n=1 Tax=Ruegeria halocynthiae TaxID=985054 RepID=A0A1H2SAX5_9RHOB|nr:TraR/DksA C4-type zinc finger protein [Ruegeria halocynthiae]SDW28730.1 transcriptional regulator, TraR/DksA family [Ruegeria halocynthiae]
MNSAELQHFRQLIHQRLSDLAAQSAAGHEAQSVVELDQQAVGRLSRMDALQNQAMAKAQQVRRDTEKHRLQAALIRMEENEFGYCEDCGEEIAQGRLELDLAASKCVSCASG